jgi:hypothetical protein
MYAALQLADHRVDLGQRFTIGGHSDESLKELYLSTRFIDVFHWMMSSCRRRRIARPLGRSRTLFIFISQMAPGGCHAQQVLANR